MPLFYDRVRETSATSGTNDMVLDGVPDINYQPFSVFDDNQFYYCIVNTSSDLEDPEWEVGIGTFTDTPVDTLVRETVLATSTNNNGGAKFNFGTGTKDIFNTVPASVLQCLVNATECGPEGGGGGVNPVTCDDLTAETGDTGWVGGTEGSLEAVTGTTQPAYTTICSQPLMLWDPTIANADKAFLKDIGGGVLRVTAGTALSFTSAAWAASVSGTLLENLETIGTGSIQATVTNNGNYQGTKLLLVTFSADTLSLPPNKYIRGVQVELCHEISEPAPIHILCWEYDSGKGFIDDPAPTNIKFSNEEMERDHVVMPKHTKYSDLTYFSTLTGVDFYEKSLTAQQDSWWCPLTGDESYGQYFEHGATTEVYFPVTTQKCCVTVGTNIVWDWFFLPPVYLQFPCVSVGWPDNGELLNLDKIEAWKPTTNWINRKGNVTLALYAYVDYASSAPYSTCDWIIDSVRIKLHYGDTPT